MRRGDTKRSKKKKSKRKKTEILKERRGEMQSCEQKSMKPQSVEMRTTVFYKLYFLVRKLYASVFFCCIFGMCSRERQSRRASAPFVLFLFDARCCTLFYRLQKTIEFGYIYMCVFVRFYSISIRASQLKSDLGVKGQSKKKNARVLVG